MKGGEHEHAEADRSADVGRKDGRDAVGELFEHDAARRDEQKLHAGQHDIFDAGFFLRRAEQTEETEHAEHDREQQQNDGHDEEQHRTAERAGGEGAEQRAEIGVGKQVDDGQNVGVDRFRRDIGRLSQIELRQCQEQAGDRQKGKHDARDLQRTADERSLHAVDLLLETGMLRLGFFRVSQQAVFHAVINHIHAAMRTFGAPIGQFQLRVTLGAVCHARSLRLHKTTQKSQ